MVTLARGTGAYFAQRVLAFDTQNLSALIRGIRWNPFCAVLLIILFFRSSRRNIYFLRLLLSHICVSTESVLAADTGRNAASLSTGAACFSGLDGLWEIVSGSRSGYWAHSPFRSCTPSASTIPCHVPSSVDVTQTVKRAISWFSIVSVFLHHC